MPDTPQNQSYANLIENFPALTLPANEIDITQIYCLNTIYYSTNGSGWIFSDGWTTNIPPCGAGDPVLVWYGLACSGDLVTGLALQSNDLLGTLPSEIGGLAALGKY